MIQGQQLGTVLGVPGAANPQRSPNINISPKRDKTETRGVNLYADFSGCGHWRMIWPEILLNGYNHAVIHGTTCMQKDPDYWANMHVVRLQRQASPPQESYARFLRKQNSLRLIYEIDDVLFIDDIPRYNKYRDAFDNVKVQQSAKNIIEMCDEMTVTCEYMKQYYMDKTDNKNVTVIPNFIPKFWMDRLYDEKQKQIQYDHAIKKRKKPRVLWSGSGAHFNQGKNNHADDFSHIINIIISTLKKYQWVLFGSVPQPLKQHVRSGQIEYHPWVPIYDYPVKLASLKATVCVAPLVDNDFNNCKSDLKFIEACALGTPVVCQDIATYKHTPYRFQTGTELVDLIDSIVSSKDIYMKLCRKFRSSADHRWLEDNIDVYKELYCLPYNHPDRININKMNSGDYYSMYNKDTSFPKL